MTSWRCPRCKAANAAHVALCEACGAPRIIPRACPFDGASLHANGFCPIGNGFPIPQLSAPDSCPSCRRPLRWDGECDACRPPDAKPGHLYTYEPFSPNDNASGHWHLTLRGPQPLAPPDPDQRAALHAALRTIERRLSDPTSRRIPPPSPGVAV